MKIVYEADDGERFYTEEACLKYERKNKYYMFNNKGEETAYYSNAVYIYIPPNGIDEAVNELCQKAQDIGENCCKDFCVTKASNICPGLYVYDFNSATYFLLDNWDDLIKTIKFIRNL